VKAERRDQVREPPVSVEEIVKQLERQRQDGHQQETRWEEQLEKELNRRIAFRYQAQ
jgi:hypothetical protein